MNYQRIYDEIIERAKPRGLNKKLLEGYFEKHHIKPKCLGGTNDKSNLVLLTAREHYLCHRLLMKIYKNDYRLIFAYHRMCFSKNIIKNEGRYVPKFTLKEFEVQRTIHLKHVSKLMKYRKLSDETKALIGNFQNGKIVSNETKVLMSNSKKGALNNFFGKNHSKKTIDKIKNTIKNKNLYDLKLWRTKISLNHADFSGSKHPRAKKIVLNGIKFDSKIDALKYFNISKKKLNKLLEVEL